MCVCVCVSNTYEYSYQDCVKKNIPIIERRALPFR